MKKKHKFKPLEEMYGHGDAPFRPKVESELANKLVKKFSRKNNHVKLKCQEGNCTSNEYLVASVMEEKAVGLSRAYMHNTTVHQASVDSHRKLMSSSETSSVHCSDSLKGSNLSQDQQLPQNVNSSKSAADNPDEEVLNCQVDDGSCVSEDNGADMIGSNSIGDADHKNETSKAPSMRPCCNNSGESVLGNGDISERLGPSGTSSFRDEQGSATPSKVVRSECSMDPETGFNNGDPSATDSLNSYDGNEYLKYNAPITDIQEPPLQGQTTVNNDGADDLVDVRVCDICGDVGRESLLALCSRCCDGAEHIYCMRIKMDKVPEGDWVCEDCTMMKEPKRQKQNEVERLDSASNLSYLREVSQGFPAMNSGVRKIGEMRTSHSGTRCDFDIEVSPTPKRRSLGRIVRPLKSSGSMGKMPLTRVSSPKIVKKEKGAAKKVVGQAYSASGHRSLKPGSDIQVRPSLKSGTLQKSVQLLKSYGSGRKMMFAQVSSLKIMDKAKHAVCQSSPLDRLSGSANKVTKRDRISPESQYRFRGGDEDLCKNKSIIISDLTSEVRRPSENVNRERKTSQERSCCQLTPKHPDKKLFKSISSSGFSLTPNKSKYHFSHTSNVKDLKYSGGRNLSEKHDSVENKTPLQGLPVTGSDAMRVNTSKTSLGSEIVKAPCSWRNDVKTHGSLTYEGRNSANSLANVGENIFSSHLSHGICSSPKNVNSCSDWKTRRYTTPKVELGLSSGVESGLMVASNKDPPVDFQLNRMKELPMHVVPYRISAVPESECIWKGTFELEQERKLLKNCSGIQAHVSICASYSVRELVHKFHSKILLKEVPRSDTWPIQFQRNHPTEQDIAIYFFAEDLQSYSRSYKVLLEGMVKNDLALEANLNGVQFLVFPSSLLPAKSQRWNSLSFLWGVFIPRKVDDGSLQNPSLIVSTLKQGLCISVTSGAQIELFSALEAGSSSTSHTSHKSIQGLESVDSMALQSSALTKVIDHSGEIEVSSKEKYLSPLGALSGITDASPGVDDWTEKKRFSGGVLHSDDYQKGVEHTNQAMRSLGKTEVFPFNQLDKEKMESSNEIGLCSYGNYKLPLPSFPWSYDSANKFSWSSLSIDSGQSGSSDGRGCAKSYGQVEQLQNPGNNYNCLNLDLCLRSGSGSEPGREVDLDLALGLSGTSEYQPEHRTRDMKLDLSLGMSYFRC